MKINSNHWDDYDDLDDAQRFNKIAARKPKIVKQKQKNAFQQKRKEKMRNRGVGEIDYETYIDADI